MQPKKFVLASLLCAFCVSLSVAQKQEWATVRFGNLTCDFPKGYQPINFAGASGVFFEGPNAYLTVTALPDTSRMKGNLDRDFTREFMHVVLDVSRKLQGKVREYRDTVIANMPGYVSRMEVSMGEGRSSYYDLIQIVHGDSVRSFSAQYVTADPASVAMSDRFFKSIAVSQKPPRPGRTKLGFLIGSVALLGIGAYALVARRKTTRVKKQQGKRRKR